VAILLPPCIPHALHACFQLLANHEFQQRILMANDEEKDEKKKIIGEFRDQGDAKWITIMGQLRGYNDTTCGRPDIGRPVGRPGVGRPQGIFGGLSYYKLLIFFFNIVPLIMEFTLSSFSAESRIDLADSLFPVLFFASIRRSVVDRRSRRSSRPKRLT
jgi:hypothetical protein